MLKFYTFLIISLLITSCATEPPDPVKVEAESKKTNDYFDRMFDEYVDRSPMLQTRLGIKKDYDKWSDISPERDDFELEQSKKSLKWLKDSVDVKLLDESTRLSYDLYLQGIKDQINDDKYRLYSYPLNQMFGMQSEIPAFLINMHRVSNLDDAEAYVARLNGVKALFDQLIENMRIGKRLESLRRSSFSITFFSIRVTLYQDTHLAEKILLRSSKIFMERFKASKLLPQIKNVLSLMRLKR